MTSVGLQKSRDVLNLTKYVTGAAINKNGESSGVVCGTALMAGLSGSAWTYGKVKTGVKAWKAEKQLATTAAKKGLKGNIGAALRDGFKSLSTQQKANKAILQSTMKQSAGKGIWASIKSFFKGGSEIVSKGKLEAIAKGTSQNAAAAQSALNTGKNFTQGLKAVEGTKGIAKSLAKGIKGNAWFAAISFGIGLFTDVIPAFKLGTDKGVKQLGKTTAKTAAEVGGWAAGAAIGAKAGAAIGACIGGPVGAAVGSIIGVAGGFIGSFLASKAADKVVGPSEVEKAQEENAATIAQQASAQGDEGISQVAQAAYNQLIQNAAANGGKLSEDDLAAKKSLENLIGYEINIEEELAQLASSSDQDSSSAAGNSSASVSASASAEAGTATAQGSATPAADTSTATADTSSAASSQSATPTATQAASNQAAAVSDLPSTSAAMYSMSSFNPYSMPSMPTMMGSQYNPFGSSSGTNFDLYNYYPMGYKFNYCA